MPGIDGMGVLERLKGQHAPPVIVLTANGSLDAAVSAMRLGAVDFVIKPASPERLEVSIRSAMKIEALEGEITRIKKKVEGTLTFDDLIKRGDGMTRVVSLGKRAASSNIPVLIEGESGVGKELIARAIQGESERAGKPFVTVNCGAIPENLVESILFGHEKGAFTGATSTGRIGKFQEADGGTLFLDEVGETSARSAGEAAARPAGRRDRSGRREAPGQGQLPPDLGHQPRHDPAGEGRQVPRGSLLPPQRVPGLGTAAARTGSATSPSSLSTSSRGSPPKKASAFPRSAPRRCACLSAYSWPGNVRQLENAMFRAIVLADANELTVAEFPQIAARSTASRPNSARAFGRAEAAPAYTGPALLGAEDTVPRTRSRSRTQSTAPSLGIPRRRRRWRSARRSTRSKPT